MIHKSISETFDPPSGRRVIRTIDAHTAGEPLRVIVDGFPALCGETILEMRQDARERHDAVRRALMWEPRGHADMYGALPTRPATPDGDVGVLFLHNEGYSTMCGHGIIGLVKVGLEFGLLPERLVRDDAPETVVRIDTPAGRVTATAHRRGQRVERVSFRNVPSFVARADQTVVVDGVGVVRYDLAYGGAFYAYVDAAAVGLALVPDEFARIVDVGMRIKRAVMNAIEIRHPIGDADLGFLYGVIFVGAAQGDAHSRNVCVFANGEVDRSPTGTGVSGRAAIHHARGELAVGATITIESLIGTTFDVSVAETTRVGDVAAIVPLVTGAAYVTGRHEFIIDPDDPLEEGVILR